jgi:hypothetical protein
MMQTPLFVLFNLVKKKPASRFWLFRGNRPAFPDAPQSNGNLFSKAWNRDSQPPERIALRVRGGNPFSVPSIMEAGGTPHQTPDTVLLLARSIKVLYQIGNRELCQAAFCKIAIPARLRSNS